MKAVRHAFLSLLLAAAASPVAAQDAPAPAEGQTSASAPEQQAEQPAQEATPALPASTDEAPAPAPSDAAATDAAAAPSSDPSASQVSAEALEAPAPLSDAELAALGLDVEKQGLDTDLHFSGFMDVNMMQLLNPDEAPTAGRIFGDEASFFVGRLNLYLNKNITETFRMMAEVRFMYAPNGATPLMQNTGTTSTEIGDYNGTGASLRWGSIMIERAYGEWSPFSFLNFRIGQFLTPYGIWNVDHGSPVVIPVLRPYAVEGKFFPERQTGLEAFGRIGLPAGLAARYHLTLSNGMGPISEYRDLDSNKAIGGRLALEYVGGIGTFQVGGSVFYGTNTSGMVNLGINSSGKLAAQKTIDGQADVTAVAADVLWKFRGLHLQGEWVGQRIEYTKSGRRLSPIAGQIGVPVNSMPPDVFNWSGYGLIGYRLPWWGIMPFATLEYNTANYDGVAVETAFSQLGLNIRATDAVVLKLEYMFAFAGTDQTQIKVMAAQLAWAF